MRPDNVIESRFFFSDRRGGGRSGSAKSRPVLSRVRCRDGALIALEILNLPQQSSDMKRFSLALLVLSFAACDEPVDDSPDTQAAADTLGEPDVATEDVPVRRDVAVDASVSDTEDVSIPDVGPGDAVSPDDTGEQDATDVSEPDAELDVVPDAELDAEPDVAPDVDAEPDVPACEDVCEVAARCAGEIVETCRLDVEGCVTWSRSADCSTDGTRCVERDGVAECTAPGCDDTAMNGEETDSDCGGPECEACDDGLGCLEPRDCISGVCGADDLCAIPECGDGVVNGEELCDDGNVVDDDGCTNLCEPNGCDGCGLAFEPPVASRLSGNSSGGVRFDDNCPAGEVLIGLNARVNGYVRRLQAVCGTPVVASGPGGDILTIVEGTTLAFRGLNPGAEESSRCPENYAVVGYGGRAGLLVDRVELSCAAWTVEVSADGYEVVQGASVAAPPIGGSGGDPVAPFTCAPGQVAVGAVIRAGDGIDAFGISCAGATVSE